MEVIYHSSVTWVYFKNHYYCHNKIARLYPFFESRTMRKSLL